MSDTDDRIRWDGAYFYVAGVPHAIARGDVLDAMERYGGSFVKALAVAWRKADMANHEKLYCVFGDYFQSYAFMAIKDALKEVAR